MKKILLLSFLTLSVAGAETLVVKTPGHWVPYRDQGVDRNHNGRIDKNEWTRPIPFKQDRPWAQPQPLQGQTVRWDLKWVQNPGSSLPAPVTKI